MKKIKIASLIALTLAAACYAKESSPVILLPEDATVTGKEIQLQKRQNRIVEWKYPEDTIRFKVPELEEGKYKIFIKYSARESGGGKILIRLNGDTIKEKFKSTGSRDATNEKKAGCFEHEGGPVTITLSILDMNYEDASIMDLYSFTLQKN